MKEKLNEIYKRLQRLNIQTTKENMELLLQCMYDLKSVYDEMTAKEAETDGQTADHE